MNYRIILFNVLHISLFYCMDIDSYEINRIELTPLHDAIIFSDIADIMHEFENSMNSQLKTSIYSDSESGEDFENLLLQYQQYLNKAHKQHLEYIEKNIAKNKVPLYRRDKFTKLNSVGQNDGNFNYFNKILSQPSTFANHFKDSNVLANKLEDNIFLNSNNAKTLLSLPPLLPRAAMSKSIDSSCYCKDNEIPCKCACKQCLISLNPVSSTQLFRSAKNKKNLEFDYLRPQNSKYVMDKSRDVLGSNLNIVIKIGFQLPNTSNGSYKHILQDEKWDEVMPHDFMSTVNLPFPFLNFPNPIDLAKYKGIALDYDSSPMHKTTIHKKKKFRTNNNNKRHKSKKVITFHNFKNDPDIQVKESDKTIFNNEDLKNYTIYHNKKTILNLSENIAPSANFSTRNVNINSTSELSNINATIPYEPMNINNILENKTHEIHKNEISVEIDSEKYNTVTVSSSIRSKRDASTSASIAVRNESHLVANNTKETKKYDKMLDNELLYWPDNSNNNSKIPSRNITALILDKETHKAKINVSHDIIQNTNRTLVLERAIFGDIDWNDTDSVVPIFMSFVGKYIRGVLTFCSQKVCHSMKCAKKMCIHRICTPDLRYNNNGHCTGNNYTDSVATMESVMDLPSNITFEVVDILQDKMLGNLYGKVTLCINSKCCTFAASKKKFFKSNCSLKELHQTGHCPSTKKN